MTARDLISDALRTIGVIAADENPSASEAQQGLSKLNQLIGKWRTQRLNAWAIVSERFPFVANKKVYTMGPDGDFDTERPQKVTKVQLYYTQNGVTLPLNMPIQMLNLDQYQNFIVPDTASSIPQYCYVDDSYPLRNIYFYTVPNVVDSVDIFHWTVLQSVPTLGTTFEIPDGYLLALVLDLAMHLAPQYGAAAVAAAGLIAEQAIDAKAAIKRINMPALLMQCDTALLPGIQGGWNYLTGGFGQTGTN
jgi:hypothetical protein